MTSTDLSLIKASFQKLLPLADPAAALFYARLFELEPSFRAAIAGDMTEQGRRHLGLLAAAIQSLEDRGAAGAAGDGLGNRPEAMGADEEHGAAVGVALLWTLEKCLGADFTPAVREAWTQAFPDLAGALLDPHGGWRLAA